MRNNDNPGVLFVYDSLRIGGCERVISVLAREMAACGLDVKILMIKKNKIEFDLPPNVKVFSFEDYPESYPFDLRKIIYKVADFFVDCALKMVGSVSRRFHASLADFTAAMTDLHALYYRYCGFMRHCFQEYPEDVIISFMDNPNVATLLAARGLPNRCIISERNHPGRDNVQPHIRKYRNRLYARADACVFQTEEEMQYYPEKIQRIGVLIPNPVKEDLPEPYEGLRNNEIVTYCRIDRQKNLIGLINSFRIIMNEYPQYVLAIYGKGNQYDAVKTYIEENNLTSRVLLRAHDSCVHSKIKNAAMFVSFSDYEGISNSMLEAMAIGMPVVCTDCPAGGARMMIRHMENGLLVPVRDEEAMAQAMRYVIENPDHAAIMGRNASAIRDSYHVSKISEKWIELVKREK